MKHARRRSALSKFLHQILRLIRHATCSRQAADDLSFVIGDGELIERAHRSRDEQNNVGRSHEHHVSSFQAETRVDQRVAGIDRQLVLLHVFAFVGAGRDSDVETTGVVRCLSDNVNDSRRRAGKQHDVLFSNDSSQPLSFRD